jgi:glycerol kinase
VHLRRPEWYALDGAIFVVSVAIVWLGIVIAG